MNDETKNLVDLDKARASRRRSANPAAPDWLEGAVVDDRGGTLANLRNVMLALRQAPEIAEAFAFNEFDRCVVVRQELPLADVAEPRRIEPPPHALTEGDVGQVQEWLQYIGLPRVGASTVHQAIMLRAEERAFHPIRDYLNSLEWDRVPRYRSWLTRYLGAEETRYTRAIGTMFLVNAVARVFEPGCQCDYVMILEGDQGLAKSSACRVLGGKWFSDSLPDITRDRDAAQHLRGKWIIEIPELSALSRAKAEALKAFISRRAEKYLPRYARHEAIEPRQCVFAGTINKSVYLKDETGGRRFLPFGVGTIDLRALDRDRDQLFAEATGSYRGFGQWWPDAQFEHEHIRAQQEARREVDPWQEPIAAYISSRKSVTPGKIAREALRIETPRFATSDMRRIGAVLVALGWRRSDRKDSDGNFPYFCP